MMESLAHMLHYSICMPCCAGTLDGMSSSCPKSYATPKYHLIWIILIVVASVQGQQTVADAVLLLPPYYFATVPDAGIENFILAVLKMTKLPSYLYNYSVHTGNVISTESYKKVAKQLPHLRGIKCTVAAMSDATPYKDAMPHLQASCFISFPAGNLLHNIFQHISNPFASVTTLDVIPQTKQRLLLLCMYAKLAAFCLSCYAEAALFALASLSCCTSQFVHSIMQAYLGGIEGQALDGLQKGLDGVIAGGDQHTSVHVDDRHLTMHICT